MARGSRQQRGARTRKAILDAAFELIGERGLRGVTYRAVADRAGVALGQMTYHYPTRADLLSAAFAHHQERLRNDARQLPAALSGRGRDPSLAVLDFLRAMVTTDRRRYIAEFELSLEMARDEALRDRLLPSTTTTYGVAVELLREAGAEEPEIDALIVSSAMDGILLTWLTRPSDRDHERRVRAAVARLFERLIPRVEE